MTDAPAQSPAEALRERAADLTELRRRIDAELDAIEHRLARIANVTPVGISSSAVRAWGLANGWKLGDRGRFPADLLHAYANRDRSQE